MTLVAQSPRDLAGQRFGRWLVESWVGYERSGRQGHAAWNCVCDCGTRRVIQARHLRGGQSRSCGCLSADVRRAKVEDLTGRRFGRWAVLGRDDAAGSPPKFRCRCDCGRVQSIDASALRCGKTHGCRFCVPPGNFIDRAGRRYGRLLVLSRVKNRGRLVFWECRCDCGAVCEVAGDNLGKGTNSCGCLALERASRLHRTHGKSKTRTYGVWASMIARCHNPHNSSYRRYGGRGIRVCAAWRKSFERFLADVGERPGPGYHLDRIKNHQGYRPGNVRWLPGPLNQRNRRGLRLFTFRGERLCLSEWAERFGHKPATVTGRLNAGWGVEKALTTPKRPGKVRQPVNVSA